MGEQRLSYTRRNVQDRSMFDRFESHTSMTSPRSAMALNTPPSGANFVTFSEGPR